MSLLREPAGHRFLVVGLGLSGTAAARWLVHRGAHVTATDKRSNAADSLPTELREALTFELGEHRTASFTGTECVVLSPGVPRALPEIQAALAKGVPVVSEIELAAANNPGPVVAITGTNGKSTTTALTGHIVAQEKQRVFVGGNLGTPFIDAVDPEVAVVELSSFQLESTYSLKPKVGLLLNVTPDHKDRYADLDAYAAAKLRMYQNADAGDVAVLNGDDARVMRLCASLPCERQRFSARDRAADAFIDGETIVYRGERYLIDNPRLRGAHNKENAAAAIAGARALGISQAAVIEALTTFSGLAHRLEPVGTLAGVLYVNDSKATNVDAAVRALLSFGERKIVLLGGGRSKGEPYDGLVKLAGKLRHLVLFGEAAGEMDAAFRGRVALTRCQDLTAALEHARTLAQAGDVVLLSPACASYDQFKNFEHRGARFRELARAMGAA